MADTHTETGQGHTHTKRDTDTRINRDPYTDTHFIIKSKKLSKFQPAADSSSISLAPTKLSPYFPRIFPSPPHLPLPNHLLHVSVLVCVCVCNNSTWLPFVLASCCPVPWPTHLLPRPLQSPNAHLRKMFCGQHTHTTPLRPPPSVK